MRIYQLLDDGRTTWVTFRYATKYSLLFLIKYKTMVKIGGLFEFFELDDVFENNSLKLKPKCVDVIEGKIIVHVQHFIVMKNLSK